MFLLKHCYPLETISRWRAWSEKHKIVQKLKSEISCSLFQYTSYTSMISSARKETLSNSISTIVAKITPWGDAAAGLRNLRAWVKSRKWAGAEVAVHCDARVVASVWVPRTVVISAPGAFCDSVPLAAWIVLVWKALLARTVSGAKRATRAASYFPIRTCASRFKAPATKLITSGRRVVIKI